jgi:hypothetical protein
MSLVSDTIDKIRVELSDDQSARWTDAQMLILIKKSVERMSKVLMKASVKFAKSSYDFSTVAGEDQYAVPADYMALDSLYRIRNDDKTGWAEAVVLRNDDEWERMISATETTNWRIWGSNIELFDIPSTVVNLRFYYWPKIDTSAWTTASTMPWSGQMDEPIAEYVALRCKNIDEKDLNWDLRLLAEMSDDYLDIFGNAEPSASTTQGFYPNNHSW